MRVPLSWLQELVEIEMSVEGLAEKLSMAGFEVEAIDDLRQRAEGVVVGKILSKGAHPNANKLSVCQIDVGESEPLQVVCGANNVREGIYVPVALVGTNLKAVGIEIKESELRGVRSQGMICSLGELGFEGNFNGIAILNEISNQFPSVGEEVASFLGLNDIILDLAITANRPDGMSMVGIAREVAALSGSTLNIPKLEMTPNYQEIEPNTEQFQFVNGYGQFGIVLIDGIDNTIETSKVDKNRLENSGINPVNNVVDILNYVMLEQGQPLHAYDADSLEKLIGREVSVNDFGLRLGYDGEEFFALDNKRYKLDENSQVVTCADIPIAIAGIIGSNDTQVTQDTNRIWLESALYTPKSIRKSAKKIAKRTESSNRFEKGLPNELTIPSSLRAIELLNSQCPVNIKGSWVNSKNFVQNKPIILRRSAINKVLGPLNHDNHQVNSNKGTDVGTINSRNDATDKYLEEKVIETCLIKIGCKIIKEPLGWSVIPDPSRKNDLSREIDLIEEIARLVGYDRFQSKLPSPINPGLLSPKQSIERKLRQALCSVGMQEVTTMSLVGSNTNEKRIPIKNPLLTETSHLRSSMFEEHIKICQRNIKAFHSGCWIFEIGNIYSLNNNQIDERGSLFGILSGERRIGCWRNNGKPTPLDYYEARGRLESVFQDLKLNITDKNTNDLTNLHPGRSTNLILEGQLLGYFGQLHPAISQISDLPVETYIFELAVNNILEASSRKNKINVTYKSYSTLPYMERDISLILDRSVGSGEIINLIKKTGRPLLENVELIDRYEGDMIDGNKCSQAFRLKYRGKKTLTEDDINPIQNKIRDQLERRFNAILRS